MVPPRAPLATPVTAQPETARRWGTGSARIAWSARRGRRRKPSDEVGAGGGTRTVVTYSVLDDDITVYNNLVVRQVKALSKAGKMREQDPNTHFYD